MEEIAAEVAMEVPTQVEVVVLVLTGGVVKCNSPVATQLQARVNPWNCSQAKFTLHKPYILETYMVFMFIQMAKQHRQRKHIKQPFTWLLLKHNYYYCFMRET
jgi:hypothetical protein